MRLLVAATTGHCPAIGWAMKEGANPNYIPSAVSCSNGSVPNARGWRVSTLAGIAGHASAVASLIDYKANLEAADANGTTSLMATALYGQTKVRLWPDILEGERSKAGSAAAARPRESSGGS